jgi:hypothetical protein
MEQLFHSERVKGGILSEIPDGTKKFLVFVVTGSVQITRSEFRVMILPRYTRMGELGKIGI